VVDGSRPGRTMAVIASSAAYVPRYRLPRELIAEEWGGVSAGGGGAGGHPDRDNLTPAGDAAVAAGRRGPLPRAAVFPPTPASWPAVGAGPRRDAVFFATTTSPWAEKQGAATIAAVLDLPAAVRTADITSTLRAGTSALLAALDAVAAGARRVLVAAADCRMG